MYRQHMIWKERRAVRLSYRCVICGQESRTKLWVRDSGTEAGSFTEAKLKLCICEDCAVSAPPQALAEKFAWAYTAGIEEAPVLEFDRGTLHLPCAVVTYPTWEELCRRFKEAATWEEKEQIRAQIGAGKGYHAPHVCLC